jgi:hypothetical protein
VVIAMGQVEVQGVSASAPNAASKSLIRPGCPVFRKDALTVAQPWYGRVQDIIVCPRKKE